MIEVTCLASGSSGNSFAVDDGERALLLEAGIAPRRMLREYAGLLSRVDGCLVSHEHQDHAKGVAGIARAGIDVYATAGTFAALGDIEQTYRLHPVQTGKQFQAGGWDVLPFRAEHDAAEPAGFLLRSHATGEKLLFATDTYYLRYRFTGVSVVMVECNYSLPLLREAIEQGRIHDATRARLLSSHFSLEHLRDFLRASDLTAVRHIYLLHVSDTNGDKDAFARDIRRATGKPVTVF